MKSNPVAGLEVQVGDAARGRPEWSRGGDLSFVTQQLSDEQLDMAVAAERNTGACGELLDRVLGESDVREDTYDVATIRRDAGRAAFSRRDLGCAVSAAGCVLTVPDGGADRPSPLRLSSGAALLLPAADGCLVGGVLGPVGGASGGCWLLVLDGRRCSSRRSVTTTPIIASTTSAVPAPLWR